MPADIYFLNHSGFILKIDDIVLVFDYYKDPLQHVEKMITDGRNKIYFFVSHFHGDHFNPSISRFEEYADGYILHGDCDLYLRDAGKMHLMDVGDSYSNEDFTVKMYGSTDAGGSFLIHCHGITIFHAGDLNDWTWEGAGDLINGRMHREYRTQIKKLAGKPINLAFVPMDPRQGADQELGMDYFLETTSAEYVFPMHMWQDYSHIPVYKKKIWNPGMAERVVEITHENQVFLIEEQ